MLGFFLFWFISLPAIWFPIHKMCASSLTILFFVGRTQHLLTLLLPFSRHLFTAKAIIVPIAGITFFIWAIVKAHGVGPIIHQPSTLHGSAKGWAMVAAFGSCMSNMATLIVSVLAYLFSILTSRLNSFCAPKLEMLLISHRVPTAHLPQSGRNLSESHLASPSSPSSALSSLRHLKSSTEKLSGPPLTY